jgi:exonuclease III
LAPSISFASQNCNSLNISTNCDKQLKKISSIVTLGICLIFLSDLRLSNADAKNEIERTFSCNKIKNYKFYHNSSKNKRGVGILLDTNYNFNIVSTYADRDENILGLKLDLGGFVFWAVSIYGPNTNDNIDFYNNLRDLVSGPDTGNYPFIIGGDWNATVSTLNSPDNIDILNMPNPPSHVRSQRIFDLAHLGKLTDPFRVLWPDSRDFTYVPRSGRNNRSGIDFFLVSDQLLYNVTKAEISHSLQTDLFDH